MRHQPAFDTNIGSSHATLTRVDLHAPNGAYIATLPIDGGQVREAAGEGWTGTLTVVGSQWVPHSPTDPLAGFTGHWVRVMAGQIVDQKERWLYLCELLITGCQIRRSAGDYELTVDLVDVLGWIGQQADTTYNVETGQTVNQAIRQVLSRARPPGWGALSFNGTAGTALVPVSYDAVTKPPSDIVADLAAVANINVRTRWDRTILIEGVRGQTPGTPVRTITTDTDIETYTVDLGRATGTFANHVELTFNPVGDVQGRARWSAQWNYGALPGTPSAGHALYDGTALWRISYRDKDGDPRHTNLRRIETGNLIEITAGNGWLVVGEVTDVTDEDQDKYLELSVSTFDTDGSPPTAGSRVTIAVYVTPEDPVIGVASQTQGPLAVDTVGRVSYVDSFDVNVTQDQADARAAQILPRMLAGWATTELDIVPDPRLQVDDTVTVRYLDGTTALHRVTTIDYPLAPDQPMRIGVRTFDIPPAWRF